MTIAVKSDGSMLPVDQIKSAQSPRRAARDIFAIGICGERPVARRIAEQLTSEIRADLRQMVQDGIPQLDLVVDGGG